MALEGGNQSIQTNDLVILNELDGVWRVLPRYRDSISQMLNERGATGRELGGLIVEKTDTKGFLKTRKHVSRARVSGFAKRAD